MTSSPRLADYRMDGYTIDPVDDGHNEVHLLLRDGEPQYVHKEASPAEIERSCHYEDRFREELTDLDDLAVPDRVAQDDTAVVHEYVGDALEDTHPQELDHALGELLGKLHSVEVPDDQFSWYQDGDRHDFDDYEEYLDVSYEKMLERPITQDHPGLMEIIEPWFEEGREELDLDTVEPALNHGDLVPQNVRYDEEDGTFYLIDLEYANIGDPMDDLAVACLYAEDGSGAAVVEGYEEETGTSVDTERLNFYIEMYLAHKTFEGVQEGRWSIDQAADKLQDWLGVPG